MRILENHNLKGVREGIFINLVPVWGVSFSVVFLGELLDPLIHISAFVLISTGIFLLNREKDS